VTACLTRAAAYLTHPTHAEHPPLWHGQDLYTPLLVVRASHLGARMLAAQLIGGAARVPAQRQGSAQVGTPVEADRAP
jgi:hypothetical protein